MNLTCHSEYGRLKSLFIKKPQQAFRNQSLLDSQWQALNFLSKPDFETAALEYEKFEAFLKKSGTELFYFSENDQVSMDSIYCRDASIATDEGMILCQMGKSARVPEPQAAKLDFEKQGIKILGEIKAPGSIEGGDVAWLDRQTLAVGHGYRSNDEGFRQLSRLLEPLGVETIQVDLPHFRGQNDVFHLMSIFSPVDKNLAVVYSPLMPVRFRQSLLERAYQLVEVPDEEFDSMGCNVLAIGPRECMIVKGNPITKSRLEQAGCLVYEYDGQHISVKGGGGPTCLTRPLWRAV